MPTIKMPNGDMVNFPDDMSKEDIKGMIAKKFPDAEAAAQEGAAEETPFGRFRSGLTHGLESPVAEGMRAVGMQPWQSYRAYEDYQKTHPSELRDWSETAGGAVPWLFTRPIGAIPSAVMGGVEGAVQPAKDWKERGVNMATGAALSELGPLASKAFRPAFRRVRNSVTGQMETVLHMVPREGMKLADLAAELGVGATLGHQFYGVPGAASAALGGEWLAQRAKRTLGTHTGLATLAAQLVDRFPQLAAYIGIRGNAGPAAAEAAKGVYDYATTPDQQ